VVDGGHGISAILQLHEETPHFDVGLRRLDDPPSDGEKFVESFLLVPLAKVCSTSLVGTIVFLDAGQVGRTATRPQGEGCPDKSEEWNC
jgi:hypothetical protein